MKYSKASHLKKLMKNLYAYKKRMRSFGADDTEPRCAIEYVIDCAKSGKDYPGYKKDIKIFDHSFFDLYTSHVGYMGISQKMHQKSVEIHKMIAGMIDEESDNVDAIVSDFRFL